jgi:hypothetical protein
MPYRRRRLARLLALWSAALIAPLGAGNAQVVATQGAVQQQFQSPMILEFPAPPLLRFPENGSRLLKDVDGYICENAYFQAISVMLKRKSKKVAGKKSAVFDVLATVAVQPSHDKLVDVLIEFVSAGKVLATAAPVSGQVEEKRSRIFTSRLAVEEGAFAAAYEAEPGPTLRLTLRVKDD